MKRVLFLLIFIVMQSAVLCEAARVIVRPAGNGTFYVEGVDFVDVGGVEIELSYDTTALANPRVAQGEKLASTMFVPNPNFKTNVVKIAAMSLSPIGSGTLAILNFDLKGSSQGNVAVSRTILASSKGSSINANSGSDGGGSVTVGGGTVATGTGGSGTGGSLPVGTGIVSGGSSGAGIGSFAGISMGTIDLPQDQMATPEKKVDAQPLVTELRKDMTIPSGGTGGSQGVEKAAVASEGKPSDKSSVAYKSVLQLFKEYKGEKSAQSLIPIFAEAVYPDFRQEPQIAVSDGVKPVKLTLKLKPSGKESPKFILMGANVQQLRGEGEDFIWIVDAVPRKGVHEANLTVIDGQRTLQFPLTVAPFVETAVAGGSKTSEVDFARYLALPAKFDFNKDGKFDYIDDYIFTANYIVAMKITPEKRVDQPKKEPAKTDKKDEKKPSEPAKPVDVKPSSKDKNDKSSVKPDEKPKTPAKTGKKQAKKTGDKQEDKAEKTKSATQP